MVSVYPARVILSDGSVRAKSNPAGAREARDLGRPFERTDCISARFSLYGIGYNLRMLCRD